MMLFQTKSDEHEKCCPDVAFAFNRFFLLSHFFIFPSFFHSLFGWNGRAPRWLQTSDFFYYLFPSSLKTKFCFQTNDDCQHLLWLDGMKAVFYVLSDVSKFLFSLLFHRRRDDENPRIAAI